MLSQLVKFNTKKVRRMQVKLPPFVLHRGTIKDRILGQTLIRMGSSPRAVNFQTRTSALTTTTRSQIEVNPTKTILPVRMKTPSRGRVARVTSLAMEGGFSLSQKGSHIRMLDGKRARRATMRQKPRMLREWQLFMCELAALTHKATPTRARD